MGTAELLVVVTFLMFALQHFYDMLYDLLMKAFGVRRD